jgi:hypothetical protein
VERLTWSFDEAPRRRVDQNPMAGSALAETGDGRQAAGELERAISLYDEGPRSGEHHGVAGKALAGTDLAMVRLRSGALDAAVAVLEPVLALPPDQRLATLTARLALVRRELAAPVFRDSQQARDLGGPDRGVRPRSHHRGAALAVRMTRPWLGALEAHVGMPSIRELEYCPAGAKRACDTAPPGQIA